MINRFEVHSHSKFSNIRLLDSTNNIEDLIDRAIELNLSGIALTDHDCLSGSVKANKYFYEEVLEKHPNFKVALGNEIYLCNSREMNQKYFHFILIAKNKDGFRALRELSSKAWMNSYYDRGMERVVTTYSDLKKIVKKFPNSLIATTACLGSSYCSAIASLISAEIIEDTIEIEKCNEFIDWFLDYCTNLFGEDFYIECAPGCSEEQIKVNKRSKMIADAHNIKMVVGCDSHFLNKEDRFIHESYLNSKGGEREVASFYEYAYLQSEEDIIKNLEKSGLDNHYEQMVRNSYEIYEKIENYSIKKSPVVPRVKVEEYPKMLESNGDIAEDKYPILWQLMSRGNRQERYWANLCYNALLTKEENNEIDKNNHSLYMERLEVEADIILTVGKKINECVFSYFNTFQHYIDLFWECGSIVGPGRGSACSFLSNYLLGITQLDPVEWNLYYWRFMNKDRVDELPKLYWAVVKKACELTQRCLFIK